MFFEKLYFLSILQDQYWSCIFREIVLGVIFARQCWLATELQMSVYMDGLLEKLCKMKSSNQILGTPFVESLFEIGLLHRETKLELLVMFSN